MDHKVSQHELEGGARLLAIQIPNSITFFWGSFFKAGYRYVDRDKFELSHLAEHLAFTGTKTYPTPDVFKSEVERDGTLYSATTNFDWVTYFFVGSRDEIDRIIKINLSQIYEPLLDEERIAQEKMVIQEEMSRKLEDDSHRVFYKEICHLNPNYVEVEKRIEDLKKITRKDILEYHKGTHSVAGTNFILAGDYTDQKLEQIISGLNKELKSFNVGTKPETKTFELGERGGRILAFEPFQDKQTRYSLRFTMSGEDTENEAALSVVDIMLTGGMLGRLHKKAREVGLTYTVASAGVSGKDMTSVIVRSQTSLDKLKPLIELSLKELKALKDGDYSDDELERARGYITGSIRRSYQLPQNFANWYSGDFLYDDELEDTESWISRVNAVTRTDINKALNKYFQRENLTLTLIGKGLSTEHKEYEALLTQYFA